MISVPLAARERRRIERQPIIGGRRQLKHRTVKSRHRPNLMCDHLSVLPRKRILLRDRPFRRFVAVKGR